MYDDRIYYEDQSDWTPVDYQGLWRYLNRLIQFIGPTEAALAHPDELWAQIQLRRAGRRDDEVRAMDPARMSEDTRYLFKHMLIHTNRYELALERFPNLRVLDAVTTLDHQLVLDEHPTFAHDYYTEVGILL